MASTDLPIGPIATVTTSAFVLPIDDATIEKVARITGLKLPPFVNAALLNSTLQSVTDAVLNAPVVPVASDAWLEKLKWAARIVTIIGITITTILSSYNASKPSPATPADVAPEKIAAAVWGQP